MKTPFELHQLLHELTFQQDGSRRHELAREVSEEYLRSDDSKVLPSTSFDFTQEIVTIYGVAYSLSLFRALASSPIGATFRIMSRKDSVVVLQSITNSEEGK